MKKYIRSFLFCLLISISYFSKAQQAIAAKKNATPAQIALAWIMAKKPWIVPIPGTTKLHRLTENNGAAYLQLTTVDVGEIETAYAQIQIAGTRYNEEMEKATGL